MPHKPLRSGRLLPASVLVLGLMLAGPALACLVCIPLPQRTLADRIVEDAVLALARPTNASPFVYAPQVYLRGAAKEEAAPIPFLVDSSARRRIAADPEVFALVGRATPEADWELLAVMAPATVEMVREIVAQAEGWAGTAVSPDRFAYFAARHASPEPAIRALALAEISSFPYAQIRTIAPQLTRAEIVQILRDPKMIEWAPIHILLLGLSKDPADRDFVRAAYGAASRTASAAFLGAWATAYLEVDGAAALERIEADFVTDPERPKEQMTEIVRALSTFAAVSEPALRDRITAQFGTLAASRPELAADAAQELTNVEDWSLAGMFEDMLSDGAFRSPVEEFAIIFYIERAREAGAL